jgi:hypothetical protein
MLEDTKVAYSTGAEHLLDYADRVALLFERLSIIRRVLPERSLLLGSDERNALLRKVEPELDAVNAQLDRLAGTIARRAAMTERLGVGLPLENLRRAFALTPIDVDLLATASVLESGFIVNQYRAQAKNHELLQADVALFVAMLASPTGEDAEEVRARFSREAPLHQGGLVELVGLTGDGPGLQRRVRVTERVLDFLGGRADPGRFALGSRGSFRRTPPDTTSLLPPLRELVGQLGRTLAVSDRLALVLGVPGSGRKSLIGAASRLLGRPLLTINCQRLGDANDWSRALTAAVLEARMQNAVLAIEGLDEHSGTEGDVRFVRVLVETLEPFPGALAFVLERTPVWLGELSRSQVRFEVPLPSTALQLELWSQELDGRLQLDGAIDLPSLARRYSLTPGGIKSTCEDLMRLDEIHDRGGVVREEFLLDVVRTRLAHRLGSLAQVVRTTLDWSDVVLPSDVLERVIEFLNFARHRQQLLNEWGFARKLPYGRGLSALFAGPPGTGKTMICSLLAKELGMELYRIDLSQVVNKYIGETEKNLGRVFDEAARGQVILLFDEADALFAKRTEVKSSHDRYANLEVNYLLQRIEGHEGVVVLTTNSESSIDPAFRRRIRFRVRFPAPSVEERKRLWQSMIPKEAALDNSVDFRVLAQRFKLSGGNILNAVVRAAVAARAAGKPIGLDLLMAAAELELTEMGFLA